MKKEQIQILQNAREICDSIAKAITKRNSGQPFCQNYCPGEDRLITIIQQLINAIKDNEPESSTRLAEELQNVKQILPNQCVNPYSFGAIVAIVNILSRKYLNPKGDTRKLFISHSSKDKAIVNGFIKEILKIGCGFKDSDVFCTLDPTVIRTGDDFRMKIVENLRECDFILLFISGNYIKMRYAKMKWVQRGHWIISAYYRLYSQTPHLMTWDFLMKLSKVRQLPTNAN